MKILKSILKPIWQEFKEPTSSLVLSVLSLIISGPIFISLYKFLPVVKVFFGEGYRIDYIIFFLLIFIMTYWIVKRFSKIFYIFSSVGFLGLLISSLLGFYTFNNLLYDYSSIIYHLNEKIIRLDFNEKKDPFSKKAQISVAVDYKNNIVRDQANNWAKKNFKGFISFSPDLKVLHALSIFKEVRSRWNYTYDPKGEDYFSKASLTLKSLESDDQMEGDCDDYSILIAGLIKSIGGEVQLVRTLVKKNDSIVIGHLYPEVKIGTSKDLEVYSYLIKTKLFPNESANKSIYYYQDKEGYIWLNFDYNDYYPGGPYQSMMRESVLNWDHEK